MATSAQRPDAGLAEALEKSLTERYGVMVSSDELRKVLAFPSKDAFRQALARRAIPVPVFAVPNRRGKFALVKDIASWLAVQRNNSLQTSDTKWPPSKPSRERS